MKCLNPNIVLFRALAILLVILGHSIILYDPTWGIYTTEVKASYFVILKKVINQIQMPLFFSISGYLFYYSSCKKYKFLLFIKNKVLRLLVPYIFIAFFYMDPIKILLGVPGYTSNGIASLLKQQIMFTNNGHLWFLPCLFFIFLFISIILKYLNNRITCLVFLALLIGLNLTSNRLPNILSLNLVSQYAAYFYIGYIGNRFTLHKNIRPLYWGFIVLLFCLTLIQPMDNLRPIGILVCLYFLYQIPFGYKSSIINEISKNSYGLYLFHSPLVYITYTYFRDISPIFVLLINMIIMGSIAYILTYVIRILKLQIVIGEKIR